MKKNHKKVLLIDFDGVIHQYKLGWNRGLILEPPVENARWALQTLVKAGYEVVIFCARLTKHDIVDDTKEQRCRMENWLFANGFKKGIHYHRMTNEKEGCLAQIDDRAVRFEGNWESIVKLFT